MFVPTLYRVTDTKVGPARLSKAKADAMLTTLAATVRVFRPAITELMMPRSNGRSLFYAMPVLPHAELWNPRLRTFIREDHGFEVPMTDRGRKAHDLDYDVLADVQSMANSMTIWVNKNLVPLEIIGKDEFSFLVDEI